jgi:TPR repeat protein
MPMKTLSITLPICVLLVSGCVGVTMESARISAATASRNDNMEAALSGDPEAQFQVGKSYCCAPRNDVDGFYNNHKATEFLCKAARQNHAEAAFELGRIYSGDTIDGLRLLRRAATAVRGDDLSNETVAYYWFNQAVRNGSQEAAERLQDLEKHDISGLTDPSTTPCTLTEVFGQP